uniref:neuromedin-K receptor-like n=2 Tax=Anopheles cruzii TaxID=68878 RepID=UPI0022EC438F
RPVYYIALGGTNDTYTNVTVPFCKVVNFEQAEIQLYRYVLVLVQYFIPLFVISFVYIQMAFRLWGSKTPGNAQDSRDITMLKNKKKVIKMLIIVVALFGVCWFPLQLYNILHVTFPEINEYRFINIIWFVCDWLAMSNSCYNPFIYGIYNEKFKREFRKRYPFKRGQSYGHNHGNEPDKTSSIFTRVSSIRSSYATSSIRNKLSTGRSGSAGPKQLPLAFKFPPPSHHYPTPLQDLGVGHRKDVYSPISCGAAGSCLAATTFSIREKNPRPFWDDGGQPVKGLCDSETGLLSGSKLLALGVATSTTDDDDDYRLRSYAPTTVEHAAHELAPLRPGSGTNGSDP